MTTVAAAYPFIEVLIDTSALLPTAERSPGVIAIVGDTGGTGSASINRPYVVDSPADAAGLFATLSGGVVTPTPLYRSLVLAMLQDPKPAKIYGVRTNGTSPTDFEAALASLDAADDVTFVALANTTDVASLAKLKSHAEVNSAAGQKRIGVMMVDPNTAKSNTYVADVLSTLEGTPSLKSSSSRVVMIAARGAVMEGTATKADVASAAMAAVAGYTPSTSMVLKRVRGIDMPKESQYSSAEIKGLSEAQINPLIQPSLIVGGGFFFGEGRCYTSDASLLYIDIVRTLDDIDFRLKAGLIGVVGDARITKAGLTIVKTRVDGILGPLKRGNVIDDYTVTIPLLDILSLPESSRTTTEASLVTVARANRTVDMIVTVIYGPAVHRLKVTLQPKF